MNDALRLEIFESGLLPWVLIFVMAVMLEVGWWVGKHCHLKLNQTRPDSTEAIVGSIFGLLALLVAFTFSGASDRFDRHRQLIQSEMSAISTAYSTVDLLKAEDQAVLRKAFIEYLDHRIVLYKKPLEFKELSARFDKQAELGNTIWLEAIRAVNSMNAFDREVSKLMLPKVLDMLDAYDNQRLSMRFHPPPIIWLSLFTLAIIGALVAGYNMGMEQKRDWVLTMVFVALMAGAIFVILNLEYPRVGSISLIEFEQEIVELRNAIK
ncbi:MAG: hypothetical protein Q8R65_10110 [Polynucleobacter sp.]|nr:hypothetical protein [Polynucleobacter sp.]